MQACLQCSLETHHCAKIIVCRCITHENTWRRGWNLDHQTLPCVLRRHTFTASSNPALIKLNRRSDML
eukprot:396704-Amphidinium_carterae.2